jgi:hypothetical protein
MFDELDLTASGLDDPPEVALIPVEDVPGLVDTAPQEHPVIVAGSGDGLVDAAAAGLLDGDELVLYAASLSDAQLRRALEQGADIVVTDSNRRRARRWDTLRDESGMTERAGEKPLRDDIFDYRLEPVPDTLDAERTVAEQRGGRVVATGYGFAGVYRPEDRPVHAFDGDERSAWRAAGGEEDAAGQRIIVEPDEPVRTGRVRLVQPLTAPNNRWLTQVRLHFDRGGPVTVALDDASRTPAGQVVEFPRRTIRRMEIEVLATSPGADPVGFAEVELGDVRVQEVIRPPLRVLDRAGSDGLDRRVVFVLSRQHYETTAAGREDAELALVRRVALPDPRAFSVAGTARVNPDATDEVLDALLGTTADGVVVRSSGRLHGDLDARASRAFDDDPSTFWTAELGVQEGQYVEIELPQPTTVDELDIAVLTDGRHSVPTAVAISVDGGPDSPVTVPALDDEPDEGAVQTVTLPVPSMTGSRFRVTVTGARQVTHVGDVMGSAVIAPVALNLRMAGVPVLATIGTLDTACRNDLLAVDGDAIPVRVSGEAADARRGLALESCGEPSDLARGSHVIRSEPGLDTGIDVDRLVLASEAGGAAAADPIAPVGAPPPTSGAHARVLDTGMTHADVRIRTDGEPFWLVLGQSLNDGWTAELGDGTSLGEPRLVDGFANGWAIDPEGPTTLTVKLRWTPQRVVWAGMTVSVLAILACLMLLWRTRRTMAYPVSDEDPSLGSPFELAAFGVSTRTSLVTAVVVGLGASAVSRLWIGALVGVAAFLATRVRGARILLVAGAPMAFALSKVASAPELAWVAVLLLAADVVCGYVVKRAGVPAPAER